MSQQVIGAVVGDLRALVPDESADIAAVLPVELRGFWERAALSSLAG